MAFYGNITHVSNSVFTFDKIYSSRAEMMTKAHTDGVYVGRYVLVDYDTQTEYYVKTADTQVNAYKSYYTYHAETKTYHFVVNPIQNDLKNYYERRETFNYKQAYRKRDGFTTQEDELFLDFNCKVPVEGIWESSTNSYNPYVKTTETIITNNNKDKFYERYEYDNKHVIYRQVANPQQDKLTTYYEKKYVGIGDVYYVDENYAGIGAQETGTNTNGSNTYYVCVGFKMPETKEGDIPHPQNGTLYPALFRVITSLSTTVSSFNYDFIQHYNEDVVFAMSLQGSANIGRGWDSTVWQKVYENGIETYVMVAELNSVVPTFEISGDAPTMTPIAPHFDEASTNTYYKLHQQSAWGSRIKAANKDIEGPVFNKDGTQKDTKIALTSDEKEYPTDCFTYWSLSNYNSKTGKNELYYYNTQTKKWEDSSVFEGDNEETRKLKYEVPAAIYWNKAGFDSKYSSYDNRENAINILPSGRSGHLYNKHVGTGSYASDTIQNDTQEISVLLPAIGNAVSEMWDLIYGGAKINTLPKETIINAGEKITKVTRNQNIAWGNKNGLRLINQAETAGLYNYTPEEISTLAGAINSVHDILGTIIKVEDPKVVIKNGSDLNHEYIYYDNGQFYGIRTTYQYPGLSEDYKFIAYNTGDKKDKILLPFSNNYYYQDLYDYKKAPEIIANDKRTYLIIKEDPTPSITAEYKKAKDELQIKYNKQEISWVDYHSQMEELDTKYQEDCANVTGITFKYRGTLCDEEGNAKSYYPGKYYYKINDMDYALDNSASALVDRQYFSAKNSSASEIYFFTPAEKIEGVNDKVGLYVGIKQLNENGEPTGKWEYNPITADDVYDSSADYFVYYTKRITDSDGNTKIEGGWSLVTDTVHPFEEGKYYTEEILEDGQKILRLITEIKSTYNKDDNRLKTIKCIKPELTSDIEFYQVNRYFYKNGDDYILDTDTHTTIINNENITILPEGRIYYQLLNSPKVVKNKFYIPGKYYTDKDCTQLATGDYKEGIPYYQKAELYVDPANCGPYHPGAIWNKNVDPTSVEGVTVSYRTEIDVPYVLEGFADRLNTLHGLLLRTHELLEDGNELTRNRETVQGAINYLNDIIDRFDTVRPGEFMIVDDAGRIVSSPYSTKQAFTWTNYGNNKTGKQTEAENQWIQLTCDSTLNNSNIFIGHNFQSVPDTITSSNNNTSKSDTISLYTPIVDAKGHVVGKNTETITLPFGFKTIATNGRSEIDNGDNTIIPNNTSIIADNTQDTLTINSGNKWVKLETDPDKDIITISHDIHSPNIVEKMETNINNNGDKITIQDIEFDNAGHMTANQKHTYVLPFGYKVFKDSNNIIGVSTADSTQDVFVFKGDSWVQPTVSNDLLTLSHIGPVIGTVRNLPDLTPAFGDAFNIEDWVFDEKGHKTNISTHKITLPKGSLIETTSKTNANILTSIDFVPTTGAITVDRTNLGLIQLGNYNTPSSIITNNNIQINSSSINTTDNLSTIIGILDNRIMTEIKDRINAIDDLDVSDIVDNTQIISTITQTDGKIAFSRAPAGTLKVSGNVNAVGHTPEENLNSLKDKIDLLQAGSSAEGSVAYQIAQIVNEDSNDKIDKLNEIANWIVNDTTGAAKMGLDIKTLQNEVEKTDTGLLNRTTALETLVGTIAVDTQIKNITGIPDNDKTLQAEIDDIEAKPSMNITNENITNWDNAYNKTHEHKNLEILSSITQDKIDQWDKAESNDVNTVLTTTEFTYSNSTMTIENLISKVAELENKIIELESKINSGSTVEPEAPAE